MRMLLYIGTIGDNVLSPGGLRAMLVPRMEHMSLATA